MSTAIREGERIRFVEDEDELDIDASAHAQLVDALAQDMHEFLDRVQAWVPPSRPGGPVGPDRGQLRALKLPPPPAVLR